MRAGSSTSSILVGLAFALSRGGSSLRSRSTVIFGFVVAAIAMGIWPDGTKGQLQSGARSAIFQALGGAADEPTDRHYAFRPPDAAVIVLKTLQGMRPARVARPDAYLAAFVWENRLVEDPSVTRLLLIGAILIVLRTRGRRDCSVRRAWRSCEPFTRSPGRGAPGEPRGSPCAASRVPAVPAEEVEIV